MSKSLNFQQLAAFRAVMQTGTTTTAAQMLNTTQPSISRRLQELQASTQLKLFELHGGRLRPTSEGRMLHKTIERYFSGLERIETVVDSMRKAGVGTLRIGCTPTLGIGLLPQVISTLLKKFPKTHIDLETAGTPQLSNFLQQDLVDIVLTTGRIEDSDLHTEVLTSTSAVCVLPLDHRLKQADRINLETIKSQKIISLSDSDELTQQIKHFLDTHHISHDFIIETPSSITVCALVAAGTGIGIVNPYVATTFEGRLLIKPFHPQIATPVQLALPTHTAPSLLTTHFIDILRAHIQQLKFE
ncbi:LysR family transcriptional regulator [Advenella kashmirensis W13003]|uniref:LysR family transcriptional regulator n=1 Tax=Advenella kashmirensis W13003 TaxID=1424334 RepID=V8QN54_9BURK|nr:LysR substrate-binding domain-containing protein [Advenella kashmirensis]ETF00740.1 LysR family transcriptional regulator [Advenella kashmirensis W13003]